MKIPKINLNFSFERKVFPEVFFFRFLLPTANLTKKIKPAL